ncbi:hypothetical protein D9M71_539100 [compost metagenome]
MARPHQVLVELQRRVDVVQCGQLLDLHGGVQQQVHAPAAHFFQRLVAAAGAQHLYLHAQLASHLAQQVDVGADQVFRVLRVLPRIGRRIGAAGCHQALALACRHGQRRYQHRHACQHPACFTQHHCSLLVLLGPAIGPEQTTKKTRPPVRGPGSL